MGQAYALGDRGGGRCALRMVVRGQHGRPGVVLSDEEGILDGAQTAGVFPVRVQVTDSRDERARGGLCVDDPSGGGARLDSDRANAPGPGGVGLSLRVVGDEGLSALSVAHRRW